MVFSRRGHRYKPGYGLRYTCSNNGDYYLYYGDICEGIDVTMLPHRWLAIYKGNNIIGRHAQRGHAESSCQKHFAANQPITDAPKPRGKRRKA